MVSLLVAQVDLVFQVAIFALLALGMLFERMHKPKIHSQLMVAAVVLNVTSLLAVMGPAWSRVSITTSGTLGAVTYAHISLGGLALLLSFWVVGSWLLSPLLSRPMQKPCYSALNKKVMWAVLFLWLASLLVGLFLFAMVNTKLLGTFPINTVGSQLIQ
jgi:hypothetical protein